MSIFVSLASFCDTHLKFTISSLLKKSSGNTDIFIGVVDQSHHSISDWLETFDNEKRVRYIHIDPFHSKGVCWARSMVGQLYDGEDYFLQIDSHTFFSQNWDLHLVNSIRTLQSISNKPIISTYPPPFNFDENQNPFCTLPPSEYIYTLQPRPNQQLTSESLVLKFHVTHSTGGDYSLGFHLAGGFIFTLGHFVNEIPYDPNFYFHGEEQGIAIRAFTHGWDIFNPRHKDIPLFHLYKKSGEDYQSHHWRKDLEEKRKVKWTERSKLADERLTKLILTDDLPQPWRMGSVRTINDFSSISGIDYLSKEIEIIEPKTISFNK